MGLVDGIIAELGEFLTQRTDLLGPAFYNNDFSAVAGKLFEVFGELPVITFQLRKIVAGYTGGDGLNLVTSGMGGIPQSFVNKLITYPCTADIKYNVESLMASWAAYLIQSGMTEFEQPISRYIIENLYFPAIMDSIDELSQTGVLDVGNPTIFGNAFNGITEIIAAEQLAGNIYNILTPSFGPNNKMDIVRAFEAGFPAELMGMISSIYMSKNVFEGYLTERQDTASVNIVSSNLSGLGLTQITVGGRALVQLPFLPDDYMFATVNTPRLGGNNMVMLGNHQINANSFSFQEENRALKILFTFRGGMGFRVPQYVMKQEVAPATGGLGANQDIFYSTPKTT